jgi:hypothetical protein
MGDRVRCFARHHGWSVTGFVVPPPSGLCSLPGMSLWVSAEVEQLFRLHGGEGRREFPNQRLFGHR